MPEIVLATLINKGEGKQCKLSFTSANIHLEFLNRDQLDTQFNSQAVLLISHSMCTFGGAF
jgi:hypothetical protein